MDVTSCWLGEKIGGAHVTKPDNDKEGFMFSGLTLTLAITFTLWFKFGYAVVDKFMYVNITWDCIADEQNAM